MVQLLVETIKQQRKTLAIFRLMKTKKAQQLFHRYAITF